MSDDHAHGEHISPILDYFKIYGALLVLTVVTVAISFMGLGAASIYVAMAVAIVKATLVAAIFMHLKWESKFNIFVFACSVIFMAIFFGFTALDIGFRDNIHREQANHVISIEQADLAREAAVEKAAQDAAAAAAATEGEAQPEAQPEAPAAAPAPATPTLPTPNPWALPAR